MEFKKQLVSLVDHLFHRMSAEQLFESHTNSLETIGKTEHPVVVFSIGKMASSMAWEFARRFHSQNFIGMVANPYESKFQKVAGLEYFQGGHPYPNRQSIEAATQAISIAKQVDHQSSVVFLISGGGSAAFELPVHPITLPELQKTYQILVNSGAEIREINTVRNALSMVKNGKLSQACRASNQTTFVVSDVPGEEMGFVSSGPSISIQEPNRSPIEITEYYRLHNQLPKSVLQILANYNPTQSPINSSPCFCLANNSDAVETVAAQCTSFGWNVKASNRFDEVDLDPAVNGLLSELKSVQVLDAPVAIVAGGEVRCEVQGIGAGGRNQAFALECIPRIAGQNIAVISFGTDGIDGNSPAAGAFADGSSFLRCQEHGLDIDEIRSNSNSNFLFSTLGDSIESGPSEINLRDVRVLVRW